MKKLLLFIALTASLLAEGLTLSGTVISDNEKMITSRFMGFVTKVGANEGDVVKKGKSISSNYEGVNGSGSLAREKAKNAVNDVMIDGMNHSYSILERDLSETYKSFIIIASTIIWLLGGVVMLIDMLSIVLSQS